MKRTPRAARRSIEGVVGRDAPEREPVVLPLEQAVEAHKLMESDFTPMASPECIAAEERKLGRPLEPRDIPAAQLINPGDDWWQQWFADNGIAADEESLRRRGVRLDNQANEGQAAMAGQGFALLTPFLWQGDVAVGRLAVPFPESLSMRGWAYWLVIPPERRMVPKIKRFREWLLQSMREAEDGEWHQLYA